MEECNRSICEGSVPKQKAIDLISSVLTCLNDPMKKCSNTWINLLYPHGLFVCLEYDEHPRFNLQKTGLVCE